MNKLILSALLLAAPAAARADQQAPASDQKPASRLDTFRAWFQHFKEGLESSGAERRYQRSNVRVTAVAAVRGSGQQLDDPNKPYIKGKLSEKQDDVAKQERAELDSAVDLVLAGKGDEGLAKLNAFEAAHPKSIYLADVRAAKDKIKEMSAAPPETSAAAKP